MCEQVVRVGTHADLNMLLRSVGIFKKGKSILGMGICVEEVTIGGVRLQHGDRLEPSDNLLDTHALRFMAVPGTITLWRARVSPITKLPLDNVHHRCPLFDLRLHSSPCNSLAVDELHTLHLGEVQRCVSASLWRVVLYNPWQFRGTPKAIADQGVKMLWVDLKSFQTDPQNGIGRGDHFQNLTSKMLGDLKGKDIQALYFQFNMT